MQKKVLVTGGAGFIGTNLCRQLLDAGHQVHVLDDLSAGDATRLPSEIFFTKGTVCDQSLVEELCREVDAVIHLAALPRVQDTIDHPTETHGVNVNGLVTVLEAVRTTGVRTFVFASSAAVYGDQTEMPLQENQLPRPKSPYALHKLIGEQYCRLWSELYGIPTISLRFFNVYGPHLDPDGPYALAVGRFLKLAREKAPLTITGDGEQTRDFIHVTDVARAIIAAMGVADSARGEVCNVGSGVETSINTLAQLISDHTTYVPARIEPRTCVASITHTKAVLGWEPTITLSEGIQTLKREWGIDV